MGKENNLQGLDSNFFKNVKQNGKLMIFRGIMNIFKLNHYDSVNLAFIIF